MANYRVGFIGFGHMAQAIARAIDQAKLLAPSQILFVQRDMDKMRENQKNFGMTSSSLENLVEKSEVLILGVRPSQVDGALKSLSSLDLKGKVLVTIVAGLKFQIYHKYLGEDCRLIRAMPNIASSVQEGMTVLSMGGGVSLEFQSFVRLLFSSMGKVMEVEESLMDISCAIAGSGPGFVFRLIESMARAGEKGGLSYPDALKMAAQTFRGAAELILQGSLPSSLIAAIATPGGTTEAGFLKMQELGLEAGFQKTVLSAAERSSAMIPK